MLIDVVAVRVMEVPIVEIVDMAFMQHGSVAASRPMSMIVIFMFDVVTHEGRVPPPLCGGQADKAEKHSHRLGSWRHLRSQTGSAECARGCLIGTGWYLLD